MQLIDEDAALFDTLLLDSYAGDITGASVIMGEMVRILFSYDSDLKIRNSRDCPEEPSPPVDKFINILLHMFA